MSPKKISFVVLYYKAYNDTLECIESLLQLEQKNCSIDIVLVDNYSNDGSFDKIEQMYKDNPVIHCIRTKENLGYARGNNVGIKYAKHNLGADFAIVLNTDAVIRQKDFCDKVCEIYSQEQFYVMGPQVFGYHDNRSQSPRKYSDDEKVFAQLLNNMLHWLVWKTYVIKLIRKFRPNPPINRRLPVGDEKYKCVCHGCCLVFSPKFLEKWDNGFDSNTFLYREELILFYILHKLGCKTLYSEDVTVYHKGGTSTEEEIKNAERKKMLFIYKIRNSSILEELRVMKMSPDELENVLR